MAEETSDDKTLHVDDDWKSRVRAEKEQLAREQSGKVEGGGGGGSAGSSGAGGAGPEDERQERRPLPSASFETLVETLATQAMLFLSRQRDPETGQPIQNLELAKHSIDLLGVLEEKTQGNLTESERKLLDTILYQIRMAYVQAAS